MQKYAIQRGLKAIIMITALFAVLFTVPIMTQQPFNEADVVPANCRMGRLTCSYLPLAGYCANRFNIPLRVERE